MPKQNTITLMLGIVVVAILGTDANAHYVYSRGRYVYHSVGCEAHILEVSNPVTSPAAVECAVAVSVAETLCEQPTGQRYTVISPLQVSLSAQTRILAANVSGGEAEVEVTVPDAPLLDINVNPACATNVPVAALIRNMVGVVTVFKCIGLPMAPCAVRLVTSTATSNCELSAEYSLEDYPQHVPPPGTAYDCTDPLAVHVL